MSNLIRIHDEDNFMIDYDNERGRYRVSYFEDGHFWNECYFSNPFESEEKLLVTNVVVNSISLKQDDNSTFITFLINKDDEERLERLCEALGKSKSEVFSSALYLSEQSLLADYKE